MSAAFNNTFLSTSSVIVTTESQSGDQSGFLYIYTAPSVTTFDCKSINAGVSFSRLYLNVNELVDKSSGSITTITTSDANKPLPAGIYYLFLPTTTISISPTVFSTMATMYINAPQALFEGTTAFIPTRVSAIGIGVTPTLNTRSTTDNLTQFRDARIKKMNTSIFVDTVEDRRRSLQLIADGGDVDFSGINPSFTLFGNSFSSEFTHILLPFSTNSIANTVFNNCTKLTISGGTINGGMTTIPNMVFQNSFLSS